MNDAQQKVREFHEKYGFSKDLLLNHHLQDWWKIGLHRAHLIQEETGELFHAWAAMDPVEIADALGDLQYVVLGTAVSAGINLQPIFEEIHRSNMTKDVGEFKGSAQLHPRKGVSYRPPDFRSILREQGFQVNP